MAFGVVGWQPTVGAVGWQPTWLMGVAGWPLGL